MSLHDIPLSHDEAAEFCRRRHVRKMALFGSILREDFRPDSDVDVLVQFEPGHVIGFQVLDMEEELSRKFGGHRVDIVNEKYLNSRIRDEVLASAKLLYHEE